MPLTVAQTVNGIHFCAVGLTALSHRDFSTKPTPLRRKGIAITA